MLPPSLERPHSLNVSSSNNISKFMPNIMRIIFYANLCENNINIIDIVLCNIYCTKLCHSSGIFNDSVFLV
jgi:hypothetical protein